MKGISKNFTSLCGALALAATALADGTEELGPPSIPIAAGTDAILAGVGLIDGQPDTIDIVVPDNVTIVQALLYWEGTDLLQDGQGETDSIFVDAGGGAIPIEGDRIGGPTLFFTTSEGDGWTSTYRQDVTGLVINGPNSIAVSGLDFTYRNNGAGLLVIVDDGMNTAEITLQDGNDAAFINFAGTLATTAPVDYSFTPASFDRPAELSMFVSSVALEDPSGEVGRPTIMLIDIRQGATVLESYALEDRLDNSDGNEWDTYTTAGDPNFTLILPAGADNMTVQLLSEDAMNGNPYEGNLPASMVWVASALDVPGIPQDEAACRVTGGVTIQDEEHTSHGSGQAGAPTAQQPQPWGEWTHHQLAGPEGKFVFHAGTASAIPGTAINYIVCSDPGYCNPARPAPAKQIDFLGVGSFRNLRFPNDDFANNVIVGESLHYFEVHIEDLGEPGGVNGSDKNSDECQDGGHAGEIADCGCPDFYRITIHMNEDPNSGVMYEVYGYARTGNYQIHPEVGSH